ncbi:MAG: hypothetical protein AB1435_10855 [Chloroflexota bacterium]|jgi:hypothetical protein
MLKELTTRRAFVVCLVGVCLGWLLSACQSSPPDSSPPAPELTPHATPSSDVFQVNGIAAGAAWLRVTVPVVALTAPPPDGSVQLFLVLADPDGTYSYLLFPANRSGDAAEQFDLSAWPLEISLGDTSSKASLWVLAVNNRHYQAAEQYGLEALVASLGIGFHRWITQGDALDDPLAAIVSASAGALYEWFGGIDVVGQSMVTFQADESWNTALTSHRSPDGGLNIVYTAQYLSADEAALIPTPSPDALTGAYTLTYDETFAGGQSSLHWYEGQDRTFTNALTDDAYEIRLTDIVQREFALSWGSIEDARFTDYRAEAEITLVEGDAQDARYGIWFNYQDDYNFIYFGIANDGRYRVAVILRNDNRLEIQDWQPHPAIRPGAATNTLSVEASSSGDITLGINGEPVASFNDRTFSGGSLAFFCYAKSVPTTCRLERLRIWERRAP